MKWFLGLVHSNRTAVTTRHKYLESSSINHVNFTNLSACEADLVPVFGKPAEIIFILRSFRIEQWFYFKMTHKFAFWIIHIISNFSDIISQTIIHVLLTLQALQKLGSIGYDSLNECNLWLDLWETDLF